MCRLLASSPPLILNSRERAKRRRQRSPARESGGPHHFRRLLRLPEGLGTLDLRAAVYIGFGIGVCPGAVIGTMKMVALGIRFVPALSRPLGGVGGGGEEPGGFWVADPGDRSSRWRISLSGAAPGTVAATEGATGARAVGPVLGTGFAVVRRSSRLRRAGVKVKAWILLQLWGLSPADAPEPDSVPVRRGGTHMRLLKPLMAMQLEVSFFGGSSRDGERQPGCAGHGESVDFVWIWLLYVVRCAMAVGPVAFLYPSWCSHAYVLGF